MREVEAELVGPTAEPAWRTWVPRHSRSAACSRWVAVWFRIVAWRAAARPRPRPGVPAPALASRLQRHRLVVAEPIDVGDRGLAAVPAHQPDRRPGRRPRRRTGSPRASRARGRLGSTRRGWSRRGALVADERRRRRRRANRARRRGGPRSRARWPSPPGRAGAAPPSAPRSPGRPRTGPSSASSSLVRSYGKP